MRFLSNLAYTLGVAFLMAALVLGAVSQPALAKPGDFGDWDNSSLEFTAGCVGGCQQVKAYVRNGGSDMSGTTTYEVYWISKGNPKSGSIISTGTIKALKYDEGIWLTYNPMDNPNGADGNYMFRAIQRPGHPGQGDLWSEQCSVTSCVVPTETETPPATTETATTTITSTVTTVVTSTVTTTVTTTVTNTPEIPGVTATVTTTPEDPEETPGADPSETPGTTITPDPTETTVTPDPTESTITPDPTQTTETPVTPDPTQTTETPVTPDPTKTPVTPDPTKTPEVPQVTVTVETPKPTEVIPTLPPPSVKLTQPVLIPVTGADNSNTGLTLSLIQQLLIYLGAGLLGTGLVLSGVGSKFTGK